MMKVLSIFGTRPEAIKMAPVVGELRKRSTINSKVCVTGQHRQMLDQVLNLFDIWPDYDLNVMTKDQSLSFITANVINGLEEIFLKEHFDWVLVHGDTITCMAASLTAFYHKIKVGHIEAGLRTSDKFHPFPEEINRRICDAIADAHFAPTQYAARNLLRENVNPETIFVTGNTIIDALMTITNKNYCVSSGPLASLPEDKRIILVTAHRRENFGKPIIQICRAILKLAKKFTDIHIVFPVHLNPNIKSPVYELLDRHERITLVEPLEYPYLVKLMQKAYLILTDSGGIQEEAPSLGKPVLVLRKKTERPEGVDAGIIKLVGTETISIYQACTKLLTDMAEYESMVQSFNPYGDGKSAKYIVDIITGMQRGGPMLNRGCNIP